MDRLKIAGKRVEFDPKMAEKVINQDPFLRRELKEFTKTKGKDKALLMLFNSYILGDAFAEANYKRASMNRIAVARELVRMAKSLVAGQREEHKKKFGEFDKGLEAYDQYVRSLPPSTARTNMLKALNGVTQAFTKLDGELYKQGS